MFTAEDRLENLSGFGIFLVLVAVRARERFACDWILRHSVLVYLSPPCSPLRYGFGAYRGRMSRRRGVQLLSQMGIGSESGLISRAQSRGMQLHGS